MPGNLPTTYPDPLGPVPRLGFGGKLRKIGTDPSAGFQFCRLPVRPVDRSGSAHSGQVDISAAKANFHQGPESLHSQTIHVSDRASNSNRETGVVRSPSHATHSVASETSLVVPESLDKVISLPPSLHPHLDWWLNESNVLRGQPLHPLQHILQIFTDASNKGWGAHLGNSTAKGVWSDPESRLHINFLELKAVFLALKSFEHLCREQIVLVAMDNTTVVSYINKEG